MGSTLFGMKQILPKLAKNHDYNSLKMMVQQEDLNDGAGNNLPTLTYWFMYQSMQQLASNYFIHVLDNVTIKQHMFYAYYISKWNMLTFF